MKFVTSALGYKSSKVYTGSDLGTIFSFTKEGRKRWETVSGGIRCQNPTILDGLLYTACSNGNVMALTMDEGKISWSMKLADSLPHDTYTISAAGDYLVVPFDDSQRSICYFEVFFVYLFLFEPRYTKRSPGRDANIQDKARQSKAKLHGILHAIDPSR